MENYSVVVWRRVEKKRWSSQEYHGDSLEDAEIIAAYYFGKEAIAQNCLKEGNLNPWTKQLIPEQMKEVRGVYITVLQEQRMSEDGGFLPDRPTVLKAYGDKTVGIFPRYALS